MIGFHYQGNSDNWPQAVAKLPAGAPVKVVDGVQRCAEAKGANPNVYTIVRHHVGDQNLGADLHAQARSFFASFVDGSFRLIARHVNAVQEYNEYFANSQSIGEKARWVDWQRACVDVWREYRKDPAYAHIDLILAEAAVGNDIPIETAQLAHNNPWCVLGYHCYVPVYKGQIRPDEWPWYSGRWEEMDKRYMRFGYHVRWFFGEGGAVGHNGPGWPNSLAPNDGWRHEDVYNGNVKAYIDMLGYWMSRATQTTAWREGRVIGCTLFTSGGGTAWKWFEVAQPEMDAIASYVKATMANVNKPTPPPVEPPPDTTERGAPRVQYARTVLVAPEGATEEQFGTVARVAYQKKQTVGFSYDDAGIGDLANRTAVLVGIPNARKQEFRDWYARWYPGVVVVFDDETLAFRYTHWPTDYHTITQPFGARPEYYRQFGWEGGHEGIDIRCPQGQNYYAPAAGIITRISDKRTDGAPSAYGWHIVIDHGAGWSTLLAHATSYFPMPVGAVVEGGQVVAFSGATSTVPTAPHLHLTLKRAGEQTPGFPPGYVDPTPYIEALP